MGTSRLTKTSVISNYCRRHERLVEKGVVGMQTREEVRQPYFSCPQFTIRSEE